MSEKVVLTEAELLMAAHVGVARHAESLAHGRRPAFREQVAGELWARHIEGACGELAFCKALGIYWNGSVGAFGVADVGRFQVRTSERGLLKVRRDEPNDAMVVLVKGRAPVFEVMGWIRAADAKRPEWLLDPGNVGRPAYFVPEVALDPEFFRVAAPFT